MPPGDKDPAAPRDTTCRFISGDIVEGSTVLLGSCIISQVIVSHTVLKIAMQARQAMVQEGCSGEMCELGRCSALRHYRFSKQPYRLGDSASAIWEPGVHLPASLHTDQ